MRINSTERATLRILHVAESAKGGVGTYLAELLPEQMAEYGEQAVRVLLPDTHASHVTGVDRRLVRTWSRRARSPFSLFRLAFAIVATVRQFQPNVIHIHSTLAGVVVRLLYGWRHKRVTLVYCPHGWAFDRSGSTLKRSLVVGIERWLARWCDKIVAISDHELRQGLTAGIPVDRLTRVLNGIADAKPSSPAEWHDHRIKVLFVGRLDHQKGFDTLLDAAQPLESRISVRIIGRAIAGPATERRIINNVAYLGWRSLAEVSAEIAAADVVVMPSRWEGFGLVALEAMRGGRAVVASAVGGLPEIVLDGITGRLVAPDAPLELMLALKDGTRATWQAMGRIGRERFLRHFTARRMALELSELYVVSNRSNGLVRSGVPPHGHPTPIRKSA